MVTDRPQEHRHELFFLRFMDDVVVLAPSRWKLRRAVKALHQVCGALGLDKHPDKTFIGKSEKGFDFLYHRMRALAIIGKITNDTTVSHAYDR